MHLLLNCNNYYGFKYFINANLFPSISLDSIHKIVFHYKHFEKWQIIYIKYVAEILI